MHLFQQHRDTSVRGSGLSIHGSRQLFYVKLSHCAAACSAAADCIAFVDHRGRRPSYCTFKRVGALAGGSMEAQRSKDTYVKKRKVGIETMLRPKPRMAMSSLNLTDSESRIIALDLISADEAQTLASYVAECLRRQRAAEKLHASTVRSATTETITIGSSSCPAGSAAELLSSIEARISQLTGLPLHEGEEPLMFTRQRPHPEAPWLDGSRVHHDRINPAKEMRQVTVLAYLSSVDDAQGGHTIFPVLAPSRAEHEASEGDIAEGVADSIDLESMARVVAATFRRGTRSLGCQQCAQQSAVPPTREEAAASDAVQKHAEAECERSLRGKNRALSVRPRAGRAIAWWHVLPNGTVDARMWHAGCVGRFGAGRLALRECRQEHIDLFLPRPCFLYPWPMHTKCRETTLMCPGIDSRPFREIQNTNG